MLIVTLPDFTLYFENTWILYIPLHDNILDFK